MLEKILLTIASGYSLFCLYRSPHFADAFLVLSLLAFVAFLRYIKFKTPIPREIDPKLKLALDRKAELTIIRETVAMEVDIAKMEVMRSSNEKRSNPESFKF